MNFKAYSIARFMFRLSHTPQFVGTNGKTLLDLSVPNDRFHAGSPMVYPCQACGWPAAILDEEWFTVSVQVPQLCVCCQDLAKQGWLDEAIASGRLNTPERSPKCIHPMPSKR
jgi:hypothetical protein